MATQIERRPGSEPNLPIGARLSYSKSLATLRDQLCLVKTGAVLGLPRTVHSTAAHYIHDVKVLSLVATAKVAEMAPNQAKLHFARQEPSTGMLRQFNTGHLIHLELPNVFNECMATFLTQLK